MEGFSVNTRLTAADWKALCIASSRRTQGRGWRGAAVVIGLPILMWALVVALTRVAHTPVEANWLGIGVLVGFGAVAVVALLVRSWFKPVAEGSFLGEWHYDFSPLGIRIRRKNADSLWSWSGVREIAFSGEHLFIWTDSITALLVPIRDLPTGMDSEGASAVLQGLRAQVGSSVEHPQLGVAVMAAGFPGAQSVSRPPSSMGRSLAALGRWLTWRRFEGRALAAPDVAIALVSWACLALLIGLDRVSVGPKAKFNWWDAPIVGIDVLGVIALGWVLWRAADPQPAWRAVLFILATLSLVAVPLQWGIDHLDSESIQHAAAEWMLVIVLVIYLARALRVLTGYRQHRAVALTLLGLWIGSGFISSHFDTGPLWYVPTHHAEDYEKSNRDIERLLMGQPGRIDAAVASMAPRSGETSLFMVGFAGVGGQKVFAGEISLAAKIIGDRYGTAHRTLLLVNDQRDLESHPLASVTGLKLALAAVGQRMDRERDALILVISSHGSQEPAISVSNGRIPLANLTGQDLKQALDEAQIHWRVVIISACHAGAFIPYLQDDHTIVITAAAPDRTSFGCSNDRDLTYFGEAFVRDALPGSPTLRAAFEKARSSIAAKGQAEKLTPSMPTAFFGAAMEEKLQTLERSPGKGSR